MYKKLIQKDIDAPEKEKGNSIKKYNILKILENIGALFTGAYLHYREVPIKTIAEINITEGVKLRRQRLDIIDKKKENTSNELFNHDFSYLTRNWLKWKILLKICHFLFSIFFLFSLFSPYK